MRRTRLRHTENQTNSPRTFASSPKQVKKYIFSGTHSISPTPGGVALFSIEKKSEKSNFAKVESGSKLIRDELSLLTLGQFQKKRFTREYDPVWKIRHDWPEKATMCDQLARGESVHLFGQINSAGPGVPLALAHLSTANPALRCGGIYIYIYIYICIIFLNMHVY